jgi:hypothetical protein
MTRRRVILLLGVFLCAGIIIFTGVYVAAMREQVSGFSEAEITAPLITFGQEIVPDQHSTVSYGPGFSPELNWTITPVFSGFGGLMKLNLTNLGETTAYISAYGLGWSVGSSYWRNCSVYVPPGGTASLGPLFFSAPDAVGIYSYSVLIRAQTQVSPSLWRDVGELHTSPKTQEITAANGITDYSYTHNVRQYYNKLNALISYSQAAEVADAARASAPGAYSLEQVLDAFDWIVANIAYVDDPGDIWQSPQTTLALRGGDCEDHAILLSSAIGNLGGNARVNLIDGHAFATVFVGQVSEMVNITRSVRLHYGMEAPALFLSDSVGLWMVVDTVGMQYGGGLPALSAPAPDWASGQWGPVQGSFLYALDATGRMSNWPF